MSTGKEDERVIDARARFGPAEDVEGPEATLELKDDDDLLDKPLEERHPDPEDLTRLRGRKSEAEAAAESAALKAERRVLLQRRARDLEAHLRDARRLPEGDRRIIVRNFGRLIERRFRGDERPATSRIFRRAYGEEGGLGMEKKRKRYVRFEGEALPIQAPTGEYHAHGATFLRLIQAYLEEIGERPDGDSAWHVLVSLCEGASFAGFAGPAVDPGNDPRERFGSYMQQMLDRIARDTDIIGYLEQVQRHFIRAHPCTWPELSPEQKTHLPFRTWLPTKFEHLPSPNKEDGAERLALEGCGLSYPSDLLPAVRLARVYWPRHVLCLPVSVTNAELEAIESQEPTKRDLEAMISEMDPPDPAAWDPASIPAEWRRRRKQGLLRAALRENGLDWDNIDWSRFMDPESGRALNEARWRRFYEARSYDLVLTALDEPQNLQLGLYTVEHWSFSPALCRDPAGDPEEEPKELSFSLCDEDEVAIFPEGQKSFVCKPIIQEGHSYDWRETYPSSTHLLIEENLRDIRGPEAWTLLSIPMTDWQKIPDYWGHVSGDQDDPPLLRPCFSAPEGWAPAVDGSIAAAMMRSLSLGTGPERLDNLMMEAVNARVDSLARMLEEGEGQFQTGLRESGYRP